MKPIFLALAASAVAWPVAAQDTRELDAHEHGVSKALIAVENGRLEIDLTAPGMDIVGFEHAAGTDADKQAVEAALQSLKTAEDIVTLPGAAGCRLTEVAAHLVTGEDDHDEDHGHEGDDDHDHDKAEHETDGHTAFHARYSFACEDQDALTSIAFPFFERFANAREIEAQFVTETGAGLAEVTADAPELTLE